eukprot:NODE_709_length_2814_cov_7.376628.p1 GENE.NODE_709_length_2814_cov_7.376628~~NODE_709_length_2814_cov_7.376628.p1  ORF type:complete len:764 (+),score=257.04 NODE_709_length_2814_cov_7.376628:164-2455(+)
MTSTAPLLRLAKQSTSPDESLELYERTARMDPNCEEAIDGAASARWARGDREKAGLWYRALLERRPNDPTALCHLAVNALWDHNVCEAYALLLRGAPAQAESPKPTEELLAWLGYTKLLLGCSDEAVASCRSAAALPPGGARSDVHLFWALALMENREDGTADEQFALAVQHHKTWPKLFAEQQQQQQQQQVNAATLAAELPSANNQVRRSLELLLARFFSSRRSGTVPPLRSVAGGGGSEAWREQLRQGQAIQVYSKSAVRWIVGSVMHVEPDMVKIQYMIDGQCCEKVLLKNSESLSLGDAAVTKDEETSLRSDELRLGQDIEVYSKSAGRWIAATVVQLSAGDVVKVKYVIDGHWCEKELLRTSDFLRVPQAPSSSEAPPAMKPESSQTSASPSWSTSTSPPKLPDEAAKAGAKVEPKMFVEPVTPQRQRASSGKPEEAPAAIAAAPQPWTHVKKGVTPVSVAVAAPVVQRKGVEELPQRPKATSAPCAELLATEELQFGQILGTGGFGAVHQGRYRGEEVAIKKLHTTDGVITPAQVEEFRKEVANLQALRHPRLVRFVGAAYVAPSVCIVTEFMPNGSLYNLLHQRKQVLTPQQRHQIVSHIAEGVGFLHGRTPPFVHRDLKSLNVVMDYNLGAKLCDFGLTQSMEKTHITRKDNEGGSPRYMAPELFDSKGRITEKVDVWALGCLAAEIFSSRLPHEECSTIQQVMLKTLVAKEVPYKSWVGIADEQKALIQLCFVFEPRLRVDTLAFIDCLRTLRC